MCECNQRADDCDVKMSDCDAITDCNITMSDCDVTTDDFGLQLVFVMHVPKHMIVMQKWVIVMPQLVFLFHNKVDR